MTEAVLTALVPMFLLPLAIVRCWQMFKAVTQA